MLSRAAASTRRTNLISSADLAQSLPISSNRTIFPKSYGTSTTLQSPRVRLRQSDEFWLGRAHTVVCVCPLVISERCRVDRTLGIHIACRLVPGLSVSCCPDLNSVTFRCFRRRHIPTPITFLRTQWLGPVVFAHLELKKSCHQRFSAWSFHRSQEQTPPQLYLSVLCGVSRGRLSKRQAQHRAHHTI